MKRSVYLLFLITSFFLLMDSLSMGQTREGGRGRGMEAIREPAVSGMFYPEKPDVLSRDVKRY